GQHEGGASPAYGNAQAAVVLRRAVLDRHLGDAADRTGRIGVGPLVAGVVEAPRRAAGQGHVEAAGTVDRVDDDPHAVRRRVDAGPGFRDHRLALERHAERGGAQLLLRLLEHDAARAHGRVDALAAAAHEPAAAVRIDLAGLAAA